MSLLRELMIPSKNSTHLLLWTRQRRVQSLEGVRSQTTPISVTVARWQELEARCVSSNNSQLDQNDSPYSSNHSPLSPNSSLAVPRTGRIHILSISVDSCMIFLWAGSAAVAFLVVFFYFPQAPSRLCERNATGLF